MQNDATQADRDTVADYFESVCDYGKKYDAYRRGQEDLHPLTQAFAAHRIAAEVKTAELSIATIDRQATEIAALKHDLDRYMAIANAEVGESAVLRELLTKIRDDLNMRATDGVVELSNGIWPQLNEEINDGK